MAELGAFLQSIDWTHLAVYFAVIVSSAQSASTDKPRTGAGSI